MKLFLLVGLVTITGCALPGYVVHTYRFEGRILDDVTGKPVAGADIRIEAKTDPFEGTSPHRAEGTTTADGSFKLVINDGWCHSMWVCPPLGILGGSGMNTLETVEYQLENGPWRTARIHDRIEPSRFTILHRMGEIRVSR